MIGALKNHNRWLLTIVVAYIGLYGAMLIYTDGLPYVMDNNESFSSLWHAANLYDFGTARSYGLADESFSPHAAAHPYVHTHQGNFPRLFAFVIYVLGARTVESQIVVTTLSVGLAAIVLVYAFFARIATPAFAALACAVFMTDYVLFAQWQVVTYRVWYSFLFFLCLYLTHRAGESGERKWYVGLAIAFCCLFYFELVFAAFVSVACAIYAAFRCKASFKRLLAISAAQGIGAFLGLGIFVLQAVGYLGAEDFARDVYLTFLARNDYASMPTLLEQAARFYESRNVIFWHNIQQREGFSGLWPFVRSFTAYDWRVHSPLLAVTTWTLVAGWLLSLLPSRPGPVSRVTVAAASGAVLSSLILLAAAMQNTVFDAYFAPIWERLHSLAGPEGVQPLAFAASMAVAMYLVIAGAGRIFGAESRKQLRGVLLYLVCGFVAYSFIYILSPGYIYSGYLARHAPFTVFLTDVMVAVGLYATTSVAIALIESSRTPRRENYARQYLRSSLGGAAALLAISIGAYWVVVQVAYLRWMPPDHYAFLRKLSKPPYQGASFVANNYAAPVAAYTGQWAYFDPGISQGYYVRKDGKFHLSGDRKYLWFADRDTNKAYLKPDYFICMIWQSPASVANQLRREMGLSLGEPGCSYLSLVRLAKNPEAEVKGIKLVDYDRVGLATTGTDSWAILKLDWNDAPGGTILDWSIKPRRSKASERE